MRVTTMSERPCVCRLQPMHPAANTQFCVYCANFPCSIQSDWHACARQDAYYRELLLIKYDLVCVQTCVLGVDTHARSRVRQYRVGPTGSEKVFLDLTIINTYGVTCVERQQDLYRGDRTRFQPSATELQSQRKVLFAKLTSNLSIMS